MNAILPELILAAAALTLLLLEAFRPGRKTPVYFLVLLGLAGAGWALGRSVDACVWDFLALDASTRYLKALALVAVALVSVYSATFPGFQREGFPWGTYFGLLLLSTVGLFLMMSAKDLLLLLVAIELVSVTSFVLTGIVREDRRSSEAAIKYFLVGAFSAGLMIYGFSILYGLLGTTRIDALLAPTVDLPALPLTGALFFVLAGFGFKLALAPFHMWAPDVYEGAPTPVTAYLSVGPKAAAFGLLLHVLPNHGALRLTPLLAAISALTMTVGNLAALRQTNVKRLLAYSSVAQMGYVLMGFTAAGNNGARAVLIYLSGYVFMNLGAFASVLAMNQASQTESIDGFKGLAQRSMPLALTTMFFMLSLTGIPPFVGFIGKFSLFSAVLQSTGLVWLAVVAAVNSVISFAYYFSIVRAMFFETSDRPAPLSFSPALAGCLALTGVVTVAVGIFPNTFLLLVQKVLP